MRSRIVLGDSLKVLRRLPAESVDLTVTSPPYNKRKKNTGWLVSNDSYSHFDDHLPEETYQREQICVLDELFRVTKPGGSAFYNHKIRWEEGTLIHPLSWLTQTKWAVKQEIVWDRGLAANMRGWRFWQVDERIYWLYKPVDDYLIGEELQSKHAKLTSIWRIKPVPRRDDHPAPFPIELASRVIFSVLDSTKGVVLDPYCGTGTTLTAAKILGHSYIGIDISPDYIKLARQRIQDSQTESQLVEAECAIHNVGRSYKERRKGDVSWPFGPRGSNSNGQK